MTKTQETKTSKLEEFLGYMGKRESIATNAGIVSKDDPRSDIYSEAKKKLDELVGKTALGQKIPAAQIPNILNNQERYQEYYGLAVKQNQDRIAEIVRKEGNIDAILKEADEKGLEGLLQNEETVKLIGSNADREGYKDWVEFYGEYQKAKELNERAKNGDLEEKHVRILRSEEAKKLAEEAAKRAKEQGYSEKVQQAAAGIAASAVMHGLYGNVEQKAAEEMKEKAAKALKDYETVKGKNLRGYIGSAFKKLVESKRTDDYEGAVQMLYAAARSKK